METDRTAGDGGGGGGGNDGSGGAPGVVGRVLGVERNAAAVADGAANAALNGLLLSRRRHSTDTASTDTDDDARHGNTAAFGGQDLEADQCEKTTSLLPTATAVSEDQEEEEEGPSATFICADAEAAIGQLLTTMATMASSSSGRSVVLLSVVSHDSIVNRCIRSVSI